MTGLPLKPPGLVNNWLKGDVAETRANQWMEWDGNWDLDVAFVGMPFDGCSVVRSGQRHGPDAVRQRLGFYTAHSVTDQRSMQDLRVADIGDVDVAVSDREGSFTRMTETVRHLIEKDINLLAIGGDHSIAEPNMAGIFEALPGKRVGLIHFDAHFDVRDLHFGAYSSGIWGKALAERYPDQFRGENIVMVGISDFCNTPKHDQWVRDQGRTVISNVTVWEKGIHYVIEQALERAGDGTDAIYVSIDIDGLDQSSAPGTAAPNPFGIDGRDACMAVRQFARHPKTVGLEVVEIIPAYDHDDMTANLVAVMALNFCYGIASRDSEG